MSAKPAPIFDIKRYAINDGPGIRTTIFLKGCPLRCIWCHNPEGWSPRPQLLYKQSKCIGCQTCVNVCPQQALRLTPQGIAIGPNCTLNVPLASAASSSDSESEELSTLNSPLGSAASLREELSTVNCPLGSAASLREELSPVTCHLSPVTCHLSPVTCVEECPTTALEICGREWPMDALMAEIEKERAVMEDSGGGVTLCGGEPLMHPDYTLELLRELGRRGFHRCVDTTLYAAPDVVKAVAANCDLFLVDLKLMDSDLHRRYTGVPNELILQNIRMIAAAGKDFRIRIPLIEGINADESNIEATALFLESLSLPPSFWRGRGRLHLLPYHDVGKDKHRRMLRPVGHESIYNPQHIPMATPSEDVQQRCVRQLEAHGLQVIIGG